MILNAERDEREKFTYASCSAVRGGCRPLRLEAIAIATKDLKAPAVPHL